MDETIKEVLLIILVGAGIALVGSFITYPPYARLFGFLFLLVGLGIYGLRKGEVESVGEESLKGKPGKDTKPSREAGSEKKSKSKKRKGKNPDKSKRKGKK